MLEGIVSNILSDYLEKYVSNFDPTSLNIGIWNGDVTLQNLLLKEYSLDNIHPLMPFLISFGVMGKLSLKIPWTKMKSEPVLVEISNVFLVLKPKTESVYNEMAENYKENNIKQNELEKYELKKKKVKKEEVIITEKDPGFVSKLVETIVNNLQIKLNNVHIRYEDNQNFRPISFGMTLESILIQSTDKEYKPTFMKEIQEETFKLLELNKFSMYLNDDQDPSKDFISKMKITPEEKCIILEKLIHSNKFQYILNPIKAHIHLKMQKLDLNTDFNKPQFNANIVFEELLFKMDDIQYRLFLSMISYFTNYPSLEPFRKYRPIQSPKIDPKMWWRYIILSKIKEKQIKKFSWDTYQERKKDKELYILLYKKFIQVPWYTPMTKEEEYKFKSIERKRSLNDLLFFRKISNMEIQKEELQHLEWEKKEKEKNQKNSSWFSWNKSTNIPEPGIIKLTDEQKLELYKFIGYEKKEIEIKEKPLNYVKMKLHFHFVNGSLTFIDSKNKNIIAQGIITNLISDIQFMEGGFKTLISIGNFELIDKINSNSFFSKIITRRKKGSNSSLMTIFIEKGKPNSKSDYYFGVTLDRIDIIFNFNLLQKVLGFLIIDDLNFKALENVAKQQVKKVKKLAIEELKLAMENKLIIDLYLDIRAPNLLIPVDCEDKDTQFLLFDFGRFNLKSDIDSKRKERVLEDKVKDSDYYDKFYFSMQDILILIPDQSAQDFFESNIDPKYSIQLLEKVSFEIEISKSLLPKQESLDKIIISGKIPKIEFHFSPEKIQVLLLLLNRIISFIDNPTGSSNSDLKLQDILNVKGPFHKDSIHCLVEVRSTRKIFFYDPISNKRLSIINLNENIHVYSCKKNDKIFYIELPLENEKIIFQLETKSIEIREKWVKLLQMMILSFDQNFSVHNIQSILSAKDEIDIYDQDQSKEQIILKLDFLIDEFIVIFENINEKIARLEFDKCSLYLNHRSHDSLLKMKVGSTLIDDLITPKIDSKNNYIILSDQKDSKDLVDITLKYSSNESPIYDKDSIVLLDFKFQNLKLFIQPKIVSKLIELGFDFRELIDKIDKRENIYSAISKSELDPNTGKKLDPRNYFKLSAESGEISLEIWNESRKIAIFSMTGSNFSFLISHEFLDFSGLFGNLLIYDYSIKNNQYQEILGLKNKQEGSLIKFSFIHQFKKESNLHYNNFFNAKMNSIRYVHIQTFWTTLHDYLKGPLLEAILREKKRKKQDIKKESKTSLILIQMDLEAISPTILLPTNYQSLNYCLGNLGNIKCKNFIKIEEKSIIEIFRITLNDMKLSAFYQDKNYPSIEKSNVEIDIIKGIENPNYIYPILSILFKVDQVHFTLSALQYQMIFDIINGNIREGLKNILKDRDFYYSLLDKNRKQQDIIEDDLKNKVIYEITTIVPKMKVNILKGDGLDEKQSIIELNVSGLEWRNTYTLNYVYQTQVILKELIGYKNDERIFDSKSNEKCLKFDYELKYNNEQNFYLNLSSPECIIIPELVLDIKDFILNTHYLRRPLLEKQEDLFKELDLSELNKIEYENIQLSKRITFNGHFGRPKVIFKQDKNLNIEFSLKMNFERDFENEKEIYNGKFLLDQLTMYISNLEKGVPIIEPITLTTTLSTSSLEEKYSMKEFQIELLQGGKTRISYNDLKFIYQLIQKFQKEQKMEWKFENKQLSVDEDIQNVLNDFKMKIKVLLSIKKELSILIVDDLNDYDIPLIELFLNHFNLQVNMIQDKSLKIGSQIQFHFYSNYYNFSIAEWEPILENQIEPVEIKFLRKPEKKIVHAITIKSKPLNFNISSSMIYTLKKTIELWKKGFNNEIESKVSKKFQLYSIRNALGMTIEYSIQKDFIELLNGSENRFNKEENDIQLLILNQKYKLWIHKIGVYPLEKNILAEIELIEGRKIITIHSGCKIINKTTKNWMIGISLDQSISLGILYPSKILYIPFKYIQNGNIIFKYEGIDYQWSNIKISISIPTKKLISSKGKEDINYCVIESKSQEYLDFIEMIPPFSIENILPYSMKIQLFDKEKELLKQEIKEKEKIYIYNINIKRNIWMKCEIEGYKNNNEKILIFSNESMRDTSFINLDENDRKLKLNLDYKIDGESYYEIIIYCNYLFINETNKNIIIKNGDDILPGIIKDKFKNPLMFSYLSNHFLFSNKIHLQIGDCSSKSFSIDSVGSFQDIKLENENESINIGVSIELEKERIKIIKFNSLYKILNKLQDTIYIKQFAQNEIYELTSNSLLNFYWKKKEENPMITLKYHENQSWCNPFKIDHLGEIPLQLKYKNESQYIIAHLIQQEGIVYIVLEHSKSSPYSIENLTRYSIKISQKGTKQIIIIPEKTRIDYIWSNNLLQHILEFNIENLLIESNIDIINTLKKVNIHDHSIQIHVIANETSRIVKIIENDEEKEKEEKEEEIPWMLSLLIDEIGFSILTFSEELMYIHFDKIFFKFKMSKENYDIEFKCKKFQINNQLRDTLYPITFTNTHKLEDDHHFIHISIIKNYKKELYDYFPYISILIQEGSLYLDYSFINKIINFIKDLNFEKEKEEKEIKIENTKKVYSNLIQLHPIRINTTFIFNNNDQSSNAILIQTLGSFNISLDDIPIKLNALILSHPFMSRSYLLESIKLHYKNNFIKEMYKAIGSMDILGNPVGLFSDLDTGIYDLFYEPIEGITKSPEDFTTGLAKGSISFLKHSLHGTFNTASKLTESIGNGLSILSLDSEYISNRNKNQKQKPKHIGEGIMDGASSLASNIVDGATGIFIKPVQGIGEEGITGFFKGIGKGIVGIPVKPITGIIDFAQKTTEGIRNTTKYFDKEEMKRTRKPRVFGLNGKLIPYDSYKSEGNDKLNEISKDKNEIYIYHQNLNDEYYLILSNLRIIYLKLPNIIEWSCQFQDIKKLIQFKNGIKLELSQIGIEKQEKSWFYSPILEHTIISNHSFENFLTEFKKLHKN